MANPTCTRPPAGWCCTRAAGHAGPCAAWPEGSGALPVGTATPAQARPDLLDTSPSHTSPEAAPVVPTKVDLVPRGMTWEETERHMRDACAQAGVQWDDDDEPQSIAINVMQRLANAAHKAGFKLALERAALSQRAPIAAAEAAPVVPSKSDEMAFVQEIEYAQDHGWPMDSRERLESIARGIRIRASARALSTPQAVEAQKRLDFHRPMETLNGEPVRYVCADVIEYKSARGCVDQLTGRVYSSPHAELEIRNVEAQQAADRYWTKPGESLMGIALRQLKDETRWTEIRDLNAASFPDMEPHDYYPVGTALKMPSAQQAGSGGDAVAIQSGGPQEIALVQVKTRIEAGQLLSVSRAAPAEPVVERCACGYPMPCSKSVPVGFCRSKGGA